MKLLEPECIEVDLKKGELKVVKSWIMWTQKTSLSSTNLNDIPRPTENLWQIVAWFFDVPNDSDEILARR